MKRFTPVVLLVLSIFFFTCNDDDTTTNTPVAPNVEVESSTVRVGCEIEKICTEAASFMILAYRNQLLPNPSCPTISHNLSAKKIVVDYGTTPCISGLDSSRKSGKYEINYYTNVASDSIAGKITFSNFQVFRSVNTTDSMYIQFSGDDDIGGKMIDSVRYRLYIEINNNFNRNNSTNGNTDISLSGTVNIGNLAISTDDLFTLLGSGTLINGGISYLYSYYDTAKPLTIYGNCKYGQSGLLKLTDSGKDMIVDYYPNNGNCDPIITITKDNVTVTVDLSSKF
ncbi:MAG: hypothetical protein L0Y76_10630 [Ignavibacteria bacterium]|nr:hypothetical protein [Ignavibacteria bacterium]